MNRGFMSLHFLFLDGARAELIGSRVILHEQGTSTEMAIDELPQARIDELLSLGVIKLVASLPRQPSEAACRNPTPATPA